MENNDSYLRTKREEAGLTQTKLAERLQVRVSTISRWEAGLVAPRPRHLKKLARILDISVPQLREQLIASLKG